MEELAKKMLDGDQVDAEVMVVLGGYYNLQGLRRTASNVDGTLTYELKMKMKNIKGLSLKLFFRYLYFSYEWF